MYLGVGLAEDLHGAIIDHLGHAVEVNQQTDEDLVGRGTVLVDSTEIAQDCDARHVLAVECQHTRRLGRVGGSAITRGRRTM